jgi:hypothetical protein
MAAFVDYSDIVFDAFQSHFRPQEVVDRKQEILEKIFEYYNSVPSSILFVGFNPAILANPDKSVFVTEISDSVLNWLTSQGVKFTYVADLEQFKADCVVATDEYFTFGESEESQKDSITKICQAAANFVITTVKDYKNQDFRDREYSHPAIVRHGSVLTSYIEIHNWDHKNKNDWITGIYRHRGTESKCLGLFNRKTMYFKQLAKFSMDAGAHGFLVHKNLMYKSLIKKNYEHVISIEIEV